MYKPRLEYKYYIFQSYYLTTFYEVLLGNTAYGVVYK